MKTDKNRFSRTSSPGLLVLVPHRDARRPLRAWSRALFAAGLPGAWSFPWAAPLAALGRPLSAAELGALARALREDSRRNGGRFEGGPPDSAALPFSVGGAPVRVFGPTLDVALPEGAEWPARRPDGPVVLGAAALRGREPAGLPAPPRVSFRAAALAVMRLWPTPAGDRPDGLSFEWEIGPLSWLPR